MANQGEATTALQSELKQTRPFGSKRQATAIAILRTADHLRRRLAGVVEPHGITLQQYNVLRILRGSHPEPLPTLEVRERLIEQAAGITRLVDRLEELGFLRRERCAEDRRLIHCWITPAGLDVLSQLDDEVDKADEAGMETMTDGELETALRVLAAVRGAPA